MKPLPVIYFFYFLLISGCVKKNKVQPVEEPPPPVVTVDSSLKCMELPPTPAPFGWSDTTIDENKNINAFQYSPINPGEIICRVNGDLYGYNKLFTYVIPTKQIINLGSTGNFLPSVNSKGWIVFSSVDNNIFKIKSNGDSLKQLTFDKIRQDPKWDYTGNAIYYYKQAEATNNSFSQLVKIDQNGGLLNSIPTDLPYTAVFKKSDKVIFLKTESNSVTLVMKDMITQAETSLITGPYDSKSTQVYFDDLTLDNNDENIYWSNSDGIFKCNLATLTVETVLKNCPNYKYDNPIVSIKPNELTVSRHVMKPITATKLFHEYKAMELDVVTKELTEVRIFN